MKSKVIAYLLWFFLGILSAHRFYLKKYGSAIFYLLTLQIVGIGWVFDAFELGRMVERYNLSRGHYGPVNGLKKSSIINLNKGDKQPQPSLKEQPMAS